MQELIKQVQEWANERGLNKPEQAKTQFLKVLSEYGETCDAIIKREKNGDTDVIDGFGDTLVTLIVLYQMISIDISELYLPCEKENYLDFSEFIADLDKLRLRLKYPDSGWGLLEIQCNDTIRELAAHIQAFGFTPEQCLQAAYNEIKNRKGVTINGTFIKDEAQSIVVPPHKKPNPVDYGWCDNTGFDSEPSFWAIEEGEEEYNKALKIWELSQVKEQ